MTTTDVRDVPNAVRELRRVQRAARRAGKRFRWGCVLASGIAPDGAASWQVTTIGGERVWLTGEMIDGIDGHIFWLQGSTPASLSADVRGGREHVAREFGAILYHAPAEGKRGLRWGRTTKTTFGVGEPPVILMSLHPPASWPR